VAVATDKSGVPEREQLQFLEICKKGDLERVKEYLLVNPLYVNVQPGGGWSALHHFAYLGDAEAVSHLLEKMADPTAKNGEGQTPGEVAHERIGELMLLERWNNGRMDGTLFSKGSMRISRRR